MGMSLQALEEADEQEVHKREAGYGAKAKGPEW